MRYNVPIPTPTFLQIVSMCSPQLSVPSSVTPKQEIYTLGISWLFNITGISSFRESTFIMPRGGGGG